MLHACKTYQFLQARGDSKIPGVFGKRMLFVNYDQPQRVCRFFRFSSLGSGPADNCINS